MHYSETFGWVRFGFVTSSSADRIRTMAAADAFLVAVKEAAPTALTGAEGHVSGIAYI